MDDMITTTDTTDTTTTTDSSLLVDGTTTTTPWFTDDQADIVKQQGWKAPSDVVRDYTELQKNASGKIKLPDENSSDEERSAFYAKIRGVDKPEDYTIEAVDGVPYDEDLVNKLRQWAFDTGVPKAAFETVIKNYFQELSDQRAQTFSEGETTLKAEWKDNYGKNLEVAKRFAREGGEEFLQFLDTTGIGNHPTVIKAFYNFGQKTLSDSLIKGDTPTAKAEDGYRPKYYQSPEMYVDDTSDEGAKARAWFKAQGKSKGLF